MGTREGDREGEIERWGGAGWRGLVGKEEDRGERG